MQRRRILWRILLQAGVVGLLFLAIGNVRVPEVVTAAPADPCANPQRPCDTTTSSVEVTTTTSVAPGNSGGQGGGGGGGGTTTTTTLPDGSTTTTSQPGNGGGQGNSGGGQGNPGGTTTSTTSTSTTSTSTTSTSTTSTTSTSTTSTSTTSTSTTSTSTTSTSVVPAAVETAPISSTVPVLAEETTTTSSVPAAVETVPTTLAPPRTVKPSVTTIPESGINASSELRIERSDGGSYSVTVIYSLNENGQPEAELRVSERMTKTAADLGFVTVRLVPLALPEVSSNQSTQMTGVRFLVPLIDLGNSAPARENKWDSVTNLKSKIIDQATEIRFGQLPINGVVAISSDEILWDEMPRLSSKSLAAGQQFGYFVDAAGVVTVLTKTNGSFGLRQKRENLSVRQWSNQMTPGSAIRIQIEGGIGEDEIKMIVGDTGSVCQVSDVGVLSAVGSGFCYVTAVQGGGSMYMSAVAETRVTEVSLLGQIQNAVVKYHISISMLLLVIFLALFLVWQFVLTIIQVRRALRTDPGAL